MDYEPALSLRDARLKALLSVRQLARKAGLSATTIHLLETGHRQPQLLSIYKISQALDVEPATIDEFRQALDDPRPPLNYEENP